MDILQFQGEMRWLSNFWPATIKFEGREFPSVENAYQAAKFPDHQRERFQHCSAGQAKRFGREFKPRSDWEQIKVSVMRSLIQQKFAPDTLLGKKLIATGNVKIEEGNKWGDTFWGVCAGVGANTLGIMIMEQRAFLKNKMIEAK